MSRLILKSLLWSKSRFNDQEKPALRLDLISITCMEPSFEWLRPVLRPVNGSTGKPYADEIESPNIGGSQFSWLLKFGYRINMVSLLDPYRLLRIEVFRTFGQIIIAKILFTLKLFFRRIPRAIWKFGNLKIRKLWFYEWPSMNGSRLNIR